MSLYLGSTKIKGVATGDAAVTATVENLDNELAIQDNLIAQITAALEGKMVPESKKTVSVTLTSNGYTPIYYFDLTGCIKSVVSTGATTVEALCGIVFISSASYYLNVTGSVVESSISTTQCYCFSTNGSAVLTSTGGGSGD